MATQLSRFEQLTRDNFDTWIVHTTAMLRKAKTLKYAKGECKKPASLPGVTTPTKDQEEWDDKDGEALGDILMAISSAEVQQFATCTTSNELWIKLQSTYASKGPIKQATLLKRLLLTRMTEDQDGRTFVKAFFEANDKLASMDIKIPDEVLSIVLLYSVPDSYENFRVAIESRETLIKPSELRTKITDEFESRMRAERSNPDALFVRQRRNGKFQSRNVNVSKKWSSTVKSDSGSGSNSSSNSQNYFRFKCNKCGVRGHRGADCLNPVKSKEIRTKPTLQREENAKSASRGFIVSESQAFTAMEKYEMANRVIERRKPWCLDSGATSHMCQQKEEFQDVQREVNHSLNLASSAETAVEAKGIVTLPLSNGFQKCETKLHETLLVPDLRMNLMSISKIVDRGYDVTFQKKHAYIYNHRKLDLKPEEVAARASRTTGLFYVDMADDHGVNVVERSSHVDLRLWHERFGHLNERDLKELAGKELAIGISIDPAEKLPPCDVCARGKQTQTPFPKSSTTRKAEILELIHSDLCGPMRVHSQRGKRYFATFIDDKSRWGEVYFLQKKSDVFAAFQEFRASVEKQTGKVIKILRSDNGKEYKNREFDSFLRENGIKQQFTIDYSPQQNGVAERRNRTLVEMARCNMMGSDLPPSFWAEAVNTANYVRNRCPSRSIEGKIPYELWCDRKPDVSNLRTFGTHVFALDKKPGKDKFASRSKRCVFLGYCDQSKGYRLWDLKKREITKSRDIIFAEKPAIDSQKPDIVVPEFFEQWSTQDVPVETTEEEERRRTEQEKPENRNRVENIDHVINIPENQENAELRENAGEPEREIEVDDGRIPGNVTMRRGPGRPKLDRTGRPGRPAKVYHMVPNQINAPDHREEMHEDFAAFITMDDPKTAREALNGNANVEEWQHALLSEYQAQIKNGTWTVVDRPENQNVIGSRWVLRTKLKADGTIEKRKARLVAKGFSQRPGVDFQETYAPVAKMRSIRMLNALAVKYGLTIHQYDVITAYLNGELDETIYMESPEGLNRVLENAGLPEIPEDKVFKLRRAIYGLKQAGRQWYRKLDRRLREMKFMPLLSDPCIYFRRYQNSVVLIAVYVDDLLVATNDMKQMAEIKDDLQKSFDMKDLGPVHFCLGIEFYQDQKTKSIVIHQRKYANEVLKRFNMENCKGANTPLDPKIKLQKPDEFSVKFEGEEPPYQSLVGSLMYLAVCTRPDLAYPVSMLSQFNSNFGPEHWRVGKRILRYLKKTIDYGLVYQDIDEPLTGYVDASWGGDLDDRRSHTGFIFKLSGAAVSWEARKQPTVARSSTESEYVGLSEAASEAKYLRNFLSELGLSEEQPTLIYNDNQGAQKAIEKPINTSRMKHVDISFHFSREARDQGIVDFDYLPTDEMVADILTKAQSASKHYRFVTDMGLSQIT